MEFNLSTRQMIEYLQSGVASGLYDIGEGFEASVSDTPVRISEIDSIDITFTLRPGILISLINDPNEIASYIEVKDIVIKINRDSVKRS